MAAPCAVRHLTRYCCCLLPACGLLYFVIRCAVWLVVLLSAVWRVAVSLPSLSERLSAALLRFDCPTMAIRTLRAASQHVSEPTHTITITGEHKSEGRGGRWSCADV